MAGLLQHVWQPAERGNASQANFSQQLLTCSTYHLKALMCCPDRHAHLCWHCRLSPCVQPGVCWRLSFRHPKPSVTLPWRGKLRPCTQKAMCSVVSFLCCCLASCLLAVPNAHQRYPNLRAFAVACSSKHESLSESNLQSGLE